MDTNFPTSLIRTNLSRLCVSTPDFVPLVQAEALPVSGTPPEAEFLVGYIFAIPQVRIASFIEGLRGQFVAADLDDLEGAVQKVPSLSSDKKGVASVSKSGLVGYPSRAVYPIT